MTITRRDLEDAAKAAGIELKENDQYAHEDHCAYWNYDDLCTCGARPNFTNKADLWDLAEKCRLLIDFSEGYVTCFQEDHYFTVGNHTECAEAVVLAAAEIWRSRK